ncbi:MAG: hypothetical protein K8H88_05385 [Sandaracinaceae bacterium]|nr:hypothetical protein [Sandaracinaceae bacterium]
MAHRAGITRAAGAALLACLLGLLGCQSPLEASCGGARVGLCGPYEHTVVREASLTPPGLPIADFAQSAHVRVVLGACAMAPSPPAVELSVLVTREADGGPRDSVVPLLTMIDGRDGDAAVGDSLIELDTVNPFIATLPAEADVTLRFVPRAGVAGCTGEALEIPYRTGPPRAP